RHKQVMKVSPAELDSAGRHRLRIAVKKLRYAAEFFASLFAKKRAQKYIASLMALQDVLGTLNDAAVAGRLLASLPNAPEASGMVRAFTVAKAQMSGLEPAWENWSHAKTFW
ncbi:MAG: CHAD domain-containing protein, partial [Burkholderiales bacterium]